MLNFGVECPFPIGDGKKKKKKKNIVLHGPPK